MEKVKALLKNKKFLSIFIPVMILVIGLGVFAYIKLSDDSIEVEVGTAEYGTVQQFYDTTGTLASGSTEKYYIYEGVVVKEVNVKTGDDVSEGDILATFDTTAMNKLINEKSKELKNAKEDYNNALNAQNSVSSGVSVPTTTASAASGSSGTATGLSEDDIRAIIEALQNSNTGSVTRPETTTGSGESTTGESETTRPSPSIPSITRPSTTDPSTTTSPSTTDTSTTSPSTTRPSTTRPSTTRPSTTAPVTTRPATTQNRFTDEDIAALFNQLQSASNSNGNGNSFNLGSLLGGSSDLTDTYKKAYENAQAEYDKIVADKKALDKGWIASGDGKVADIYIKAGEAYEYVEDSDESNDMLSMILGSSGSSSSSDLTDMLSGMLTGGSSESAKKGLGMVVDYYGGYKVTFNLGKYDAQTIKLGMPAIVTYTDYEYDAEVTYIAPYAESGASAITTMMGSSSTTTSALAAEATITDSDNNLIIGFDTKLSILIAEKEDVLKIPVEALAIEDGKKFVYVYDEETSTAVKALVETGASSETHYEIVDGLNEGDKVILNPSKVSDGAEVYIKK